MCVSFSVQSTTRVTGLLTSWKGFGRSRSIPHKVSHDWRNILCEGNVPCYSMAWIILIIRIRSLQELLHFPDLRCNRFQGTTFLQVTIICFILNSHCRYVQATDDRVTVVFSTVFRDDDDVIIGKVFMQVNSLSFCLACHYIWHVPLEIMSVTTWSLIAVFL